MRRATRRGRVPLCGGLIVCVVVVGGCATDDGSLDETGAGARGTLAGGGASSQEAAQIAWRAGFQLSHDGVEVSYDPIGSSGGREQFLEGGFAFAASDAYLSQEDGEIAAAAERCGGAFVEVPNYISPIAIVFNVEGVEELNLSPATLAGIFNGSVSHWDAPAIAADNPRADLPAAEIVPVYRTDGSGTTESFTDYLSTAAGGSWPHGSVDVWPKGDGVGVNGTTGVVAAVTGGRNTIGYADASQAGDLVSAKIGVGSRFVAPSAWATAQLFAVSPQVDGRPNMSLVFDLDYGTNAPQTYPIALASYLLACATYEDETEGALVKEYLGYVVGVEGQLAAADATGSAPLSGDVAERARSIVASMGG